MPRRQGFPSRSTAPAAPTAPAFPPGAPATGPAGIQRFIARHRRTIAIAGAGVLALVIFMRPTNPGDARVLVFTRDVTAGEVLVAADVAPAPWPAGAVPASVVAAADAVGRPLRLDVAKGVPVLREFIAVPRGLPTVTVKLARPAKDVRVGDSVRVWARYGTDGSQLVATHAMVDALIDSGDTYGSDDRTYAVLQIDPADEAGLAAADAVVLVRQP